MKTITLHPQAGSGPRGTATIATVVVLTTAMLIGLAGLLNWSTNGYRHVTRATTHTRLLYAAESGLQYAAGKFKLLPRGGNFDRNILSNEFAVIATSNFPPDIRLVRFTMTSTSSNAPVTIGKYKGLYQIEAVYDIRCRVCDANDSTHAVELQLKMGSLFISPFQFGVFYNENLEIHPGYDMTIGGRVHCNKNIYMWPEKKLIFNDPVTSVGAFIRDDDGWNIFASGRQQGQIRVATNVAGSAVYVKLGKRTSDGNEFDSYVTGDTPTEYFDSYNTNWAVTSLQRLYNHVLDKTHGTEKLTLPFGGAEDFTRVLIDPPVNAETASMACVRMVNRAAFVIETNNIMYYQTGSVTNSELTTRTLIGNVYSGSFNFVSHTNYFWNGRQDYMINPLDFNMGLFKTWLASGSCPTAARDTFNDTTIGSRGGIIYVNQIETGKRTYKSTNMAIRITNAAELPRSLTFATPHALYIQGNFNTKIGTTANTNYPCAVLSDCFTPLSSNWVDRLNRTNNLVAAGDTTYNTALIVGNSMSTTNVSGGGLHNLPRLLEDWTDKTLTIQGSMVCLYPAAKELAQHVDSGSDYYLPPTRNFLYDGRLGRYESSPPGVPNFYRYGLLEWRQVE